MSHADDEFKANVADLYKERLRGGKGDQLRDLSVILKEAPEFEGMLAMDLFGNRIAKRRDPPWLSNSSEWLDTETTLLRYYLSTNEIGDFAIQNIEHAIIGVAHEFAFHPVRDYLRALVWDGKSRINCWLGWYLGALKSEPEHYRDYVDAVGRMFLISCVARVMDPGCKVDNVLVLEGHQGLGKSTAVKILAGEWFADTTFEIGDKDALQNLPGTWIYELGELGSLTSVQETRSKNFLSSQVDKYRASYASKAEEHKRQTVFVATTNDREYLKDSTGNRRFWPVMCRQLKRDDLIADRDQLWAEAFSLWEGGARHWLEPTDPLYEVVEAQQQLRALSDPWETLLGDFLEDQEQAGRHQFTIAGLLEYPLGIDPAHQHQRQHTIRIGRILSRLGYQKRQAKSRAERASARFYYEKRDISKES